MRLSAEWTVLADERILEFLQENKSGTPTKMANHENIHFSRSYLHKRCDVLVEKRLVEDYGNAVFVLTDKGDEYLSGELNLNDYEPEDEE